MVRSLIISLASVLILFFISYDHSVQLRTQTTGGLSEKNSLYILHKYTEK